MESFEINHNKSKDAAIKNLRKTSKLLMLEHECECVLNLDVLIEEEHEKMRKILGAQIEILESNSTLSKIKVAGIGLGIGIVAALGGKI